MTANNSHAQVVAADSHEPKAHASTHNAGGTDAMTNPQFTTIELGHASDTTIARASAGNLTVEGNALYRAGGTDVAVADGGTGASTKAAGFDALSPMTTSGDIIYGGASGTGTRLAKGTDGQVLTLASGVPSWATPGGGTAPRKCLVHNSAAQSINNNTETTATFDTEDSDASGIHSSGTFTPPAGDWRVTVNFEWAASTGGQYRAVYLRKNGTTYVAADQRPPANNSSNGIAAGSVSYEFWGMSGTDTFQVRVAQNSGGALNLYGGNVLTSVSVTEII